MSSDKKTGSRFEGALRLLPQYLRTSVRTLSVTELESVEEIRLRIGRNPAAVICGREVMIGNRMLQKADVDAVISVATGASAYSSHESMRSGFITASGGYRIGLGGTVIVKNGAVDGFRAISSLNIRIPNTVSDISRGILPELIRRNRFLSTLIISPPCGGKTTLLRDMIRVLSDEEPYFRVTLIDERSEIAAVNGANASFNVGRTTDILDSCPKADGIAMALRSLSPQIIAFDEITSGHDIKASLSAQGCGVSVLTTAHAEKPGDLLKKDEYRSLVSSGLFEKLVTIDVSDGKRRYSVRDMYDA